MTQLVVHSSAPVSLTWATSTGSTQRQRFMTAGVMPWPHLLRLFSGRFTKDRSYVLSFAGRRTALPKLFRRSRCRLFRRKQSVRSIVADEQRTEVRAAAFGRRVADDDELLLLGEFDFDPSTAASATLVERIRPFGDQAFQQELPCNLEKLFSVAPQLIGEADIVRSFLPQLGKQLSSFDERSSAQIVSL